MGIIGKPVKITEAQLLRLKQDVATAKQTVSELTGQQKTLMKQLSDDYDFTTLAAARTERTRLETEKTTVDTKIETRSRELVEKYNIDLNGN